MIDLSAAATVAVSGAVLCSALKIVASGMDAYELGYKDGKDYAAELLLGPDHGKILHEFIEWRTRRQNANKSEPNANE